MKSKARYTAGTPRSIPTGRIIVHNHVRPRGYPDVGYGQNGFRVWSDVHNAREHRVCRCGWAPHLSKHYQMTWAAKLYGDGSKFLSVRFRATRDRKLAVRS